MSKTKLTSISQITYRLVCFGMLLLLAVNARSADSPVQVDLDPHANGPRVIEDLTQKAIVRDYRTAWSGLAHAVEFTTEGPLEGSFSGEARQWLQQTVESQAQSHLSQRYSNQRHHLEAVFYAPEGDVMELHDTATYQLQILDGNKTVSDQQVTVRYVVLMTPAADRWVVRQIQAVPHF